VTEQLEEVVQNGHLFKRSTGKCEYCGVTVLDFFWSKDEEDCTERPS